MTTSASFEDLLAEAASAPVAGWDFSWFDGRATEERPPWGYSRVLARRMAGASIALDLQTGGGEVLAEIPQPPPTLVATEAWPPNIEVAHRNLQAVGASLVVVPDDAELPFASRRFDLVVSRHPTVTIWGEIARVLVPGGTYLSQQIGAGSLRELTDFMMGPQPVGERHRLERQVEAAEAVGLTIVTVEPVALRTVFDDVGAVAVFLRKVPWTVPSFSIDRYRDRLADLHAQIQRDGPFVAHAQRFLIEVRRPA